MAVLLPTIDPKTFWRVMGMRAIGGAVVTARTDTVMSGFLALSVTHLTQSPPTLMVSIAKTTSALVVIRESGYFAVNYLSASDGDLADVFGGRTALKGAERFEAGRWHDLVTKAPVLKGAVGTIECQLVDEIERYNSVIAIGQIVNSVSDESKRPLVYFSGAVLD